MVIFIIAGLISAVIVSIWYSKKKQALYNEYQKQMQQYINQLEEPKQEKIEEYTFFFNANQEKYDRFVDTSDREKR